MADLALALTMAIWGSSFAVLRFFIAPGADPTSAASPLMVLALRMALASGLLGLFLLVRRWVRPAPPMGREATLALLRDGALCGALLGLGFLFQTEGLSRTTASRSGFLTGLLVVFVPLFEFLLYKKRPAKPALVALALAFIGMAVLSGPVENGGTTVGDLLTFLCAIVFALQILALGRAAPRHPILELLLCQLIMVGVMAAIAGPIIEPTHLPRDPKLALAIVYLAVLATLLAFGVQTWAQRIVSPLRMALLSSLEPVFAAVFAALLIGERLSLHEKLGGALIISGVLVGELGAAVLARRVANSKLEERG